MAPQVRLIRKKSSIYAGIGISFGLGQTLLLRWRLARLSLCWVSQRNTPESALTGQIGTGLLAFHLSVLKEQFPDGIRVLSLFSGIGGAEVALHRLGVGLNVVVSVEKSKVNKVILSNWWKESQQTGVLIQRDDVEKVNYNELEILVKRFGGFDLIIGGSPCNNISGGNRYSRVGLGGEQSGLFYHYVRILKQVREIMRKMKRPASL